MPIYDPKPKRQRSHPVAEPVLRAKDLKCHDYSWMQESISTLHNDAIQSGADALSLAHAIAPLAVELLLQYHPPEAVEKMLSYQVAVIADMVAARDESTHEGGGLH